MRELAMISAGKEVRLLVGMRLKKTDFSKYSFSIETLVLRE